MIDASQPVPTPPLRDAFTVLPYLPARLGRLRAVLGRTLDGALGLATLTRRYHGLPESDTTADFVRLALAELGAQACPDQAELARVPKTGPTIVVANHPHGGLDGLVLMDVLLRHRPDVKFLANHFLAKFAELRSLFLTVDPFGGTSAIRYNIAAARAARQWLASGGLLVLFPGGEVSSFNWRERQVLDPTWDTGVVRLVARSDAPVVPAHISGRNSLLFQACGLVHPRLRTALLAHEMLSGREPRIDVRFGLPVTAELVNDFDDAAQATRYLRAKTYLLGAKRQQSIMLGTTAAHRRPETTIAEPIPRAVLAAEIAGLANDQCLLTSGPFQVLFATAAQIPWTLQEIGRLREISFRQVGEGTGKAADIDVHDDYYRHLFVWHSESHEIIGGYRLGHTDEILANYGPRGLYVHSLFKLSPRLQAQLYGAIEVGRSFVCPEYQRSYSSLMLLWKGIAHYVARNPRYRVLFGPVSISNDYHPLSQRILVDYLRNHRFETERASLVKPRHPFRPKGQTMTGLVDLDSDDLRLVADLLGTVEQDDRGVPVLLRQYLKLGGQIMGFNIDPQFKNSIDCLLWVDLMRTELPLLRKYMSLDGASRFRAYHETDTTRAAAG